MAEPGVIYLKARSISVQDETGGTVKVNGSPAVSRELSDKQNWWKLRPVRELPPIPVDENGVPYHLCSGGHYRPRRAFNKNASRRTGLDNYCQQCKHEQNQARYAREAAMAGRTVRNWKRRNEAV